MPSHNDILPTGVDLEILSRDIQAISSGDAIAAFFARLGYNTNARVKQTPANLGMAAEGTIRPIRNVELIADHEGFLQVYLFELTSVTVTHTRALARAFKNRVGDQLLVLTSDYETLDFVLLEKYLPADESGATPMTQKQVSRRPRVLTVNRRNASPVQLRVLRRFTWTEPDPFAQYDKLVSAYSVADWSEEYFNNHALFSDYFLKERLPEEPQWREQSKPAYLTLKNLYRRAPSQFAQTDFPTLVQQLFEPIFGHLGFALVRPPKSEEHLPHFLLQSPGGGPTLATCLAYRWNRNLDGKDDKDAERPAENPSASVVSLLEKGESRWAVVTNGKLWRLYSAEAHSRATNYYEIDLQEILAETGAAASSPGDAFPFFWLLFRREAFTERETDWDGGRLKLGFLDLLLRQSQQYAKELGESLKRRVFEEIFPHLAQGFITYIRTQEGGQTEFAEPQLASIFQGTLTLLYRILFLLYAESRNLLPVREVRGYFEGSLTRLKQEIAERAGSIEDERWAKLGHSYREDSFDLYERLNRLFRTIDQGDPAVNVPVYNGGLFLSDPKASDRTPDAVNARFLGEYRVPDTHLAMALDLLARDVDPKKHSLVMIDYKSLGVRHLGSIYEGLLEFKIRIAGRKLGIAKQDGNEVYTPFADLDERQQARAEREGRVVKKGRVYLENDKHERKASGSYYTPDHIVKYIVEDTVGPVLKQKFDALRPKVREMQVARRAFFKKQEALKKQGLRPEPDSKADLIGQDLADEFFNSKVLDPAMGSGHFLVEAVDFITDKTLDFLSGFPANPVFTYLGTMRKTILQEMEQNGITIDEKKLTDVNLLKRHVLKRCIYGVDLNPMAVELAKVSLWLDCFTLGAPLSFLDHHLRCGNSLIGVTVREVENALSEESGTQFGLFETRFPGLLSAVDAMRQVGELSDITNSQIGESRAQYRKAEGLLAPLQRWLDVYTSQWFGNGVEVRRRRGGPAPRPVALVFLKDQRAQGFLMADDEEKSQAALRRLPSELGEIAERALVVSKDKRFFHWELEFPEVFYGPRPGTKRTIERLDGAGFDAVIGNPPYEILSEKETGADHSEELSFFAETELYAPAMHGKRNLFKLFICRGVVSTMSCGTFSFIVPMSLLGDEQSMGVRTLLLKRTAVSAIEVFPQKDDPRRRVFSEAKLATCVFVTCHTQSDSAFRVRTQPGAVFAENAITLMVTAQELFAFDPVNAAIPSCTQRDWELAVQICKQTKRVADYCEAFQGEVNETTDGKKGFVSTRSGDGPQILRGSSICLYVLREQSQGELIYLRKDKYLAGKPDSEKAGHHRHARIGWQESSAQNNFRRIIAARIPEGHFCNHKINYIPACSSKLHLNFLLALLNSKLSDWFFRLSSTNAAVSHYQVYRLPTPLIQFDATKSADGADFADLGVAVGFLNSAHEQPGTLPPEVAAAIEGLCARIQEVESARPMANRSERSSLSAESQHLQDVIDAVLFRCFGLTEDDATYINERLKEML